MRYQYRNYENSIIAATDPETGNVTILQPGFPGWDELMAEEVEVEPFTAEPEPVALDVERAGMVVSRFQARAALLLAGLLDDVETALADASPLARLAWADASEFRRNSPMIAELAAGLDLSPETLDDLFRTAAGIEA